MLDNKITLFSIQNESIPVKNKSLVLTGVNAILIKEKFIYSEFDELNYSMLNHNDYGFGEMEIEFCFENNFIEPYTTFHAGCFSIRTEDFMPIKVNGHPNAKWYSKINKDNKFVIGICYFFETEEERRNIINCDLFCIEGFIAFKKKKNVFGIMCRLRKIADEWRIIDANTYRTCKNSRITNLYH